MNDSGTRSTEEVFKDHVMVYRHRAAVKDERL